MSSILLSKHDIDVICLHLCVFITRKKNAEIERGQLCQRGIAPVGLSAEGRSAGRRICARPDIMASPLCHVSPLVRSIASAMAFFFKDKNTRLVSGRSLFVDFFFVSIHVAKRGDGKMF